MAPLKNLLFCLILLCPTATALKFLFYNAQFGRSHVMYVGKMADLLAQAGHDVVNYQPVNTNEFNDTGVKYARTIQRPPSYEFPAEAARFQAAAWKPEESGIWKMMSMMKIMFGFFSLSCEHQLRDTDLMNKLRAEKFDFAFTEYFDMCGLLIFEHIGVKNYGALIAGSLNNLFTSAYGIPSTLSFVPEMGIRSLPPLSLIDRTQQVVFSFAFSNIIFPAMTAPNSELAKKYLRPGFDLQQRVQEASIIFVNINEFLDFPRPISHKMHYCGGIGMTTPEKLAPKFEKILSSANRGVVYMSFGTVAKSKDMTPEIKRSFLDAFSEFPDITFLWKYEDDDGVADGYKNIITEKWWPQKDLLVHPKVLAFITHGGANSISEAATAGVPVITIPVFGDQSRNALMTEFRGFGVMLEKSELSKEKIVEAVRKIVDDKSYNKNAKELRQLLQAKPYSPEDIFIKYSEFAAKNDIGERLDLYGRHLPFWEFYNLDVFAFLFAIVMTVLVVLFLVLRCVVRCACRRRVQKAKKE